MDGSIFHFALGALGAGIGFDGEAAGDNGAEGEGGLDGGVDVGAGGGFFSGGDHDLDGGFTVKKGLGGAGGFAGTFQKAAAGEGQYETQQ